MSKHQVAAIVLAAGQGTRMRSRQPKVMHALAGRPMLLHVLDLAAAAGIDRRLVVVGPDMAAVSKAAAPVATVLQAERLGTGHAVAQCRSHLTEAAGTVLVLYGDTPLLQPATLQALLQRRQSADDPGVVVLGFRPPDPADYGRLLLGDDGLLAIVEARDATPEQRALTLCNGGIMAIDGTIIWDLLERLGNDNAKGEYYLTDLVALARAQGRKADFVEAAPDELLGVNSRAELAAAEHIVQRRLRQRMMAGGATLTDPDSVYFSWDTELGQDVVIGPQVVFGPGVTVADEVTIRPFCHLEGVTIESGAVIGPFARLRPGSQIGVDAHVGNFVEIKNATLGAGAKVNHLSYVGDASIGDKANLGAGTITCNYDGYGKHHTEIGAGAFIGSNSALVAPVTVGPDAIVGAGSVITKDVAPGALAVARGSQMELPGWAGRFRSRKESGAAPAAPSRSKPE